MEKERNQAGFGAVRIILVALAISEVTAISWALVQNTNKTTAATNTPQTTNQQASTTTIQPQQPATQYLDIKEWGIKLPLPDSVKNAYYIIGKGSSDGPGGVPTTVWLGLSSFTGSTCNPANNDSGKDGALGAIYRIHPTETDPVTGQLLTQEYPNGTTIGGYYYAYKGFITNNPCASQTTLQPIDSAFIASAKSTITDATN